MKARPRNGSARNLATGFAAFAAGLLLVSAYPALARPYAPRYAESTRTTPPSAFLRHVVQTKPQLIAELNADSGARTGYAKVFHIAPWAVATFLKQHAAPVAMPATGKYTVWRVTNEGTIYPTVQGVSRGEKVFALHGVPHGLPNYISDIGDPMKPFATAVTVVVVRPAPVTKIVTRVSPSQETIVPTSPEVTIVPVSISVYPKPAAQAETSNPPAAGLTEKTQ